MTTATTTRIPAGDVPAGYVAGEPDMFSDLATCWCCPVCGKARFEGTHYGDVEYTGCPCGVYLVADEGNDDPEPTTPASLPVHYWTGWEIERWGMADWYDLNSDQMAA